MLNLWCKYLLFAFFVLFINNSYSQKLPTTKYTTKNGLSQNYCSCLKQDSRGFLWIGSKNGSVNRFDGNSFSFFRVGDTPGKSILHDIEEDISGNLWIATDEGVFSFDGNDFKSYLSNKTSIEKLIINDDKVFFLRKGKLSYLNIGDGSIVKLESNFEAVNFYLQNSSFWIVSKENTLLEIKQEGSFLKIINTVSSGFAGESIVDIAHDDDRGLLVLTDKSLFEVKNNSSSLITQFKDRKLAALYANDSKEVWISSNKGAIKVSKSGRLEVNEKNGLDKNVHQITEDFQGGVWFCTDSGIYRLNNQTFKNYSKNEGFSDAQVLSIAKGTEQSIYVGTKKGLDVFRKNGSAFEVEHVYLIPDKEITLLFSKPEERSLVYVGGKGFVYLLDGNNVKKLSTPSQENLSFFSGIEYQNDLLLGTSNGIYKVLPEGIVFDDRFSALEKKHVRVLKLDNSNNLWVGTYGDGIYKHEKDSLKRYDNFSGLPSMFINDLSFDFSGNVWVASNGGGLCKIPSNNYGMDIISYPELMLPSFNISTVGFDSQNNLWIGTSQGLSKVSIIQNDELSVENYSKDEGFLPVQILPGASIVNSDGSIWLGTIDGLVQVKPDKKVYSSFSPTIHFRSLIPFKKETYSSSIINPWTNIPTGILDIPISLKVVEFTFNAISLSYPSNTYYQWMLEGHDENWSIPSKENRVFYVDLPADEYTFLVKTANNFSQLESAAPTAYSFRIRSPFYQSKLFFFLAFIFSVSVLVLFFRVRVKSLQRNQLKLQRKVKERTQEIELQKQEIEAQTEKLASALSEIERKNSALKKANEVTKESMRYAKTLQSAILTYRDVLFKTFPSSFIFERPKQIVSGDFVWIKNTKNYTYLALVDSTGNGIPAALISILGYDMFNQVFEEIGEKDPASLLSALHSKVLESLNPEKNEDINDGMDISFLRIDREKEIMTFSGARRPLFYIQGGEILMVKGSFFSVGIYYPDIDSEFENHDIKLTKDTMIYLASDGFANQFNLKGKKYKTSNFRDFILDIHKFPLEDQKELLSKEFSEWKQNADQIDDVFVLGVKVYG